MGHYHSCASRIKVKADAPAELIAKLDQIYGLSDYTDEEQQQQLKNLLGFVVFNAVYMPEQHGKKEQTDYGWLYTHIGSSTYDYQAEFAEFLNEKAQWFAFDKGDIARRAVYESHAAEELVIFNGKKFVVVTGYVFQEADTPGGFVNPPHLHPYESDLDVKDKDGNYQFMTHGYETLPWTFQEVIDLKIKEGIYEKEKGMGTYTGIATRLKIKPTMDPQILEFFKLVYKDADPMQGEGPASESIQRLISTIRGRSGIAYFPDWCWSYVLDQEDGSFLMESRSSMKWDNQLTMLQIFFQELALKHLQIEPGDIIARGLVEDGSIEYVLYFDGEKLVAGQGYIYAFAGEDPLRCVNHPRHELRRWDDHIALAKAAAEEIPWNINQINELNEVNRKASEQRIAENSFGYGICAKD